MQLLGLLLLGLLLLCSVLTLLPFASAPPSSSVESHEPLHGSSPKTALNITFAPGTLTEIPTKRGYDPSTSYRNWAAVEILTGGSSRAPINWGDLRGANLSTTILGLLHTASPASSAGQCPGSPKHSTDWQEFKTNTLVNDDPFWEVQLRSAWFRVERGQFASEQIRVVMMRLVAETLRAYTRYAQKYNCYDIPGDFDGVYCNVPKHVRVNLPPSVVGSEQLPNYMHIETWSTDKLNQTGFTKGMLRPCKTRKEVDRVMDQYQSDLTKLFPQWKGRFHREVKVIIDGYKSCTTEP